MKIDSGLLKRTQLPKGSRAKILLTNKQEMIKNLLCIFLVLAGITATAQTTPIPDPNFEQFLVNEGIDTNGINGNILDVDAQAVTVLNLSTLNRIIDITGINAFRACQSGRF